MIKHLLRFSLLSITFTILSCGSTQYSAQTIYDYAKKSYRTQQTFFLNRSLQNIGYFNYLKKTILKESFSNNESHFTIYDEFLLDINAKPLERSLFVVIDGKPFEHAIEDRHISESRSITENTEDIETVDSTTVEVVSSYTVHQHKLVSFNFDLTNEEIAHIKDAMYVQFQYYFGPDILTVRLSRQQLEDLKSIINQNPFI